MISLCALVVLITACTTNHQKHHSSIGRGSSFTSFSLQSSSGKTFALSSDELRELEKIWPLSAITGSTEITNNLYKAPLAKLAYSFELSDGYALSSDAYLGTVSGSNYLSLVLPADGGGFTADTYSKLVLLESILSPQRRSDLMTKFSPSAELSESLQHREIETN